MPIEQPRPNLMRDLWMADRAKNDIAEWMRLAWWERLLEWLRP